jgi:hypothetical protein
MLTILAKPSLANKLEIIGLDKQNLANGSTPLHGMARIEEEQESRWSCV